jgi:hypothetical protein
MSEVGDLSFVVNDGTLSESFSIERSTGSFQLGGWVTTSTILPGWGVVSVATQKELEMIPEGDRRTGAMVFHTEHMLYETNETKDQTSQPASDVLIWGHQKWRLLSVWPYPNRRYWKAVAVRLYGA